MLNGLIFKTTLVGPSLGTISAKLTIAIHLDSHHINRRDIASPKHQLAGWKRVSSQATSNNPFWGAAPSDICQNRKHWTTLPQSAWSASWLAEHITEKSMIFPWTYPFWDLDDTIHALLATQLVIPCLFVDFQWFLWTLNFCPIWWTKATSVCWIPGMFLAKTRCAICSQCLFVETTHELPFLSLSNPPFSSAGFLVALKLIDGMGDVRQLIRKLRAWVNGWWIADVLNNMRIIMNKIKIIYNLSYLILVIFHDMLVFIMIEY